MKGIRFDGDDKIINYIESNRHLLCDGQPYYQHGHYHVENMVISPDNVLAIIDLNRFDFGDLWEEFNRIVWSATASLHLTTGQINSYFDKKFPIEFSSCWHFIFIATHFLQSMENSFRRKRDKKNDIILIYNKYWEGNKIY